ncbi:MAG: ABC transporter permease, partial [Acidimicrobiales bacterium]
MNIKLRTVLLSIAAPVTAVAFSVGMSSIVLLIAGSNPLEAYSDMIQHASKLETQIDILNRATPLYISGVAAAIGFRMNLFNIGVEGQYLLAALFAAAVGGAVSLPTVLHISLIFIVGMAVGSAYAGVAGWMKTSRGINEVISTIMLNGIAISGLVAWLVRRWQAGGSVDATTGSASIGTEPIDDSGLLPDITSWLEVFTRDVKQGKQLTGVLVVAAVVGVAYYVLLNRTRFGFDLRATGINPFAARAGGIAPKRMVLYTM